MPVSDETMQHVLAIVIRHVDPRTARRILNDLQEVPGDKGFRELITRLRLERLNRSAPLLASPKE